MTPTQYQHLSSQLAELKAAVVQMDGKLDAALVQEARHDEQIKTLQRSTGGALGVGLVVVAAWLKQAAGL